MFLVYEFCFLLKIKLGKIIITTQLGDLGFITMMNIHISYTNPISHMLTIKIIFNNFVPEEFQLPAWRPGRYELQDFAQNISNIQFTDGENAVEVTRKTKDLWRLDSVASKLEVTYDYYAKQMDAGGTWLDEEQVYVNFVTCILQPVGYEREAINVFFDVPPSYEFATSLKVEGNKLIATDYYQLVDSPVICSASLRCHKFLQNGCEFYVWIQGECEPNWSKIEKDFVQYTAEQVELFGEFPCAAYHYLFQILPYKHYHGVEHGESTVITLGPGSELNNENFQTNLLGISSHELFHTWNVCRIKPEEFLPHYDFSQENYYETGYITEGITTYYGDYMLGRSGVFDTSAYFKEINQYLKRYFENDGRLRASLVDSSFKLWLDGYKVGVPAAKVSIYIKGALAALILDLEIREATTDDASLDDVMRELWRVCGEKKHGYNHEFYQAVVEKVTRQDFGWYFEQVIFGTEDLLPILNDSLGYVGCEIIETSAKEVSERLFGYRTIEKKGYLKVVKIASGSPSSECLDLDDEIITVNGRKPQEIDWSSIEKSVLLEVYRLGERRKIEIHAIEKEFFKQYFISKKDAAKANEKDSFEKWLKKSFNE